jgi:putative Ca2+/H+ antiporter (TMEM165/GDT1 family)
VTALWSSFAVVALAEMGDKTQLVALMLASRYRRPWTVMLGILIATAFNHVLAASVGVRLAEALPRSFLAWALGLVFIAFGFWALVPDRAGTRATESRWGPLLTSVLVFFLAEMGDKTQLATLALGAHFDSTVAVTAGTTLGMLAADGLAVFAGDRLTAIVPMRTIRWIAAALFFAFGAAAIAGDRLIGVALPAIGCVEGCGRAASRRLAQAADGKDSRLSGIWRAAVDQRSDPHRVLGIAAPVGELIRALPHERGFDGGRSQSDSEVPWDCSPRVAQAEDPIEHEVPDDLLEVGRVPVESHLGATSRLGKGLGRDGRVPAEVPKGNRRRAGMLCRVFRQHPDHRALGILENRPLPYSRSDLQLVRVLGGDENAKVDARRTAEGDDASDVVQRCLAGGHGLPGGVRQLPSIRCELPLPLESDLESIYLFEVSARADLPEVLARPPEEYVAEALPVRCEPLWLPAALRLDRLKARTQRVEAGEDLEVRPYERWQGQDRGRVEQVRIEVGPGRGRSQGGVVRIEAEDDLPERLHRVGMKKVVVHLLRAGPVEGEVVHRPGGWVPPVM